jgi:hypothetical protein
MEAECLEAVERERICMYLMGLLLTQGTARTRLLTVPAMRTDSLILRHNMAKH